MLNPKYAAYQPADPYFSLVRRALGGLVEGEHFFDIVAEDIVYEVLYASPVGLALSMAAPISWRNSEAIARTSSFSR